MFKTNKKLLIVIVIVSIISLVFSGCEKKEEGIVAKVNGEVITQEEFDEDFETTKKILQKQLGKDALSKEMGDNKTYEEVLREDILGNLIIEKILAEELENMNMSVTDEDVAEAIKIHYIDELGGEEKFKEYLKNNGFTDEFFKKELKKVLTYEKHREDFFNKTKLTETEMKKYYDENKESLIKVRASHILVKTEEEGKKILKRLKNGENFHSLATTESIDFQSAASGGDLGYFSKGMLLKEYEELENTALKLDIGETSELIKTELGYHVVLVEDRKDSYEDLKEDIIPILKYKKHDEKISELKEKADIKIYMKEYKNNQ